MTDYTDTLGRPVRVTVAPDGTTMFLDTVVGVDMNGKPITVSSLNDITGAALRDRQEFFERVCDATATLMAVLDDDEGEPSRAAVLAAAELRAVVWPDNPHGVDAYLQEKARRFDAANGVISEDDMHVHSRHMEQARNNAYTLGKIAGDALKRAGVPSVNPYDSKNTELAGIWQRGYLDGQK